MTEPTSLATAPGHPGLEPRWTSSAKSGVGTALDWRSRVWFAVSYGIVDEIYYPRVDEANTRDFGLVVTADGDFFSEEKRDTFSVFEWLSPGVPAFRLTNTCKQGRYRITKTILADPETDVLLQHVRFEALVGARSDYRVHALLAPHIGNQGFGNDAWMGDYKGHRVLFARRGATTLALDCSVPFVHRSVGFVGTSDGWQDLRAHGRLTWEYTDARDGNVALSAELDFSAADPLVLAVAFGRGPAEAGQRARLSLARAFDEVVRRYGHEWQRFQEAVRVPTLRAADAARLEGLCRTSATVLRTHEDKATPGGFIASLSIPWGSSKGDHDLGGYHLVWPRDLVESAGGLLAVGRSEDARRTLAFLLATQEADGHWPQNMWLDGVPYWNAVQMDETAFPILLADHLRRLGELGSLDPWPAVRRAAAYVVSRGPVTEQDRWEEDGGYSPFTLAVEVAALLAAADFADAAGDGRVGAYLRDVADAWNEGIERWTYVSDTPLARQVGVPGYYARIAPPDVADASSPKGGFVPIKNRPPGEDRAEYEALVSPDALALVRLGLRAPDDPRIANTVRVVDAVLCAQTTTGPAWRRYNGDGYGEHEDGSPFDGTGTGRAWPLLAGERGHYELAAGRASTALELLRTMARQASDGGLLPEQVWDAPDLPERELRNGRATGSAMPLAWAHAEYLKLARSIADGAVFDMPPQPVQRYQVEDRRPTFTCWRTNHRVRTLPAGRTLRVELTGPSTVSWAAGDGIPERVTAQDTGLGVWYADLPTASLRPGDVVRARLDDDTALELAVE